MIATETAFALPPLESLLTQGGDARIVLQRETGKNQYGMRPHPEQSLLALGSATASPLSESTYFALAQAHKRLQHEIQRDGEIIAYADEVHRIKQALLELCGLQNLAGLELLLTASGTDSHRVASELLCNANAGKCLKIVMVEISETGSGVWAALNTNLNTECVCVPLRQADGTPRHADEIDAEFDDHLTAATHNGQPVLLVMADCTKSGMIAPSVNFALSCLQRFGESLTILVDACQFRLAPTTLHSYLSHGLMVALTGSKFISGPSFSGALLLPEMFAKRLNIEQKQVISKEGSNFGLLLRWIAALKEWRNFNALSNSVILNFLTAFKQAIQQQMARYPALEYLPTPPLSRAPFPDNSHWDGQPSIFPFIVFHQQANGTKTPFNQAETRELYLRLQNDTALSRFQLAQPVACGQRDGIDISALRLCLSARQIVEATTAKTPILSQALNAIEHIALSAEN